MFIAARMVVTQNVKGMNSYTPGLPAHPGVELAQYLDQSPYKARILEILAEAHSWLCKENEDSIKPTLAERGWLAAFNLQPDDPFPERK